VPLYSLLYVSRSLVGGQTAQVAVADIVDVARRRNAALQVRGALLFTGARFAQALEGPRPAVEELMRSINRDARHTDIVVIHEGDVARPRFAKWALAYSGPSDFVGRTVDRALNEAATQGERARGRNLLRMLQEFESSEWREGASGEYSSLVVG
jgi:Sensors of blue-light using FAD